MFSPMDIFHPEVKENNGVITVSGIDTGSFIYQIERTWKTTRVTSYLFNSIRYRQMSFCSFFGVEFLFILERMISDRKTLVNVRRLKDVREQLFTNTWLGCLRRPVHPRVNLKRLDNLEWELLPFQRKFVESYDTNTQNYDLRGMLLAGTAGSGKTFTSIALAECLGAERVIIFCPKNAVERVWVDNIQKVFKTPQSYWFAYNGKPYKDERFLIFHYESQEKAFEYVSELGRKNAVIILDESHNLTNMAALRTSRFLEFCEQSHSRDIIYASGTPIKAAALETIPLFMAIDPHFNETVVDRFKKIYRGSANRATEILANRIDIVSFKIEKKELKLGEPLFVDLKVATPNSESFTLESIGKDMKAFVAEQFKRYNASFDADEKFFWYCLEMVKEKLCGPQVARGERAANAESYDGYLFNLNRVIKGYKSGGLREVTAEMMACNRYEKMVIIPNLPTKELKERFKHVKSIVKYLGLKIQGECLGRILGGARIDATVELSQYIDYPEILSRTEKKTVIFTSFVAAVEEVAKITKRLGMKPLVVYGKTTGSLPATIKQFEVDADTNPLAATFASLSTAVPLVMADTMITLNAPFRNYIFEQAISRIHRLGATSQAVIYNASLDTGDKPNITSRNIDILKWSQSEVEKIMQVESPYKLDDAAETIMQGSDTELDTGEEEFGPLSYIMEEFKIPKTKPVFEELFDPITPVWNKW